MSLVAKTEATPLDLRGFGVAFRERVVLADVTLEVSRTGLTTIVGPAGTGKSTLLRTLAGLNDMHPSLVTWGTALVGGEPLDAWRPVRPGELRPAVGMVVQHARFFVDSVRDNLVSSLAEQSTRGGRTQTELVRSLLARYGLAELLPRLDDAVTSLSPSLQRRLAIACALVADPPILLVDEPTMGLDDEDAIDVFALLRVQSRERAVVVVTREQRLARVLGGTILLLEDGRVRELSPAEELSESMNTLPPPPPFPTAVVRSRASGPRGFFWVRPGRLGALPRPGVVDPLERDVEGLKRLGVTTLVSLEETFTVDAALLAQHGISSVHFPIADMSVPSKEAAVMIAGGIGRLLRAGGVVAVHCRAGLGRTGTILAAQLIHDGEPARSAVERIRRIHPHCIQSSAQLEFLSSFEAFLWRNGKPTVTLPAYRRRS
ncbi:MAG: ATP-binding cassette domain-containing protein [Labilithrix sp.]|nr:ATP-binding cassette domain-containing protein [Labilithrix sp.]MCW5811841.1 ATP-binding cassette domain-containing protein [Labilithrix sp.]